MTRSFCRLFILMLLSAIARSQTPSADRPPIMLPTSKMLTVPSPGRLGSTNSFPATMVVSPDGHYAALLDDGYGTQETLAQQSISVLDLKTNRLVDYPDARFGEQSHQSYFLGLAFSSDGKHLYASVGSLTDPTGATSGNMGNGIAVYQLCRRQGCAREIRSHCASAAIDRQKACSRSDSSAPHGDSVSCRNRRDLRWRPRQAPGRE